jgi:hypothetical protein
MSRRTLLVALVFVVGVPVGAQTLADVVVTLDEISAEAQAVLLRNAALRPRNRLPDWVLTAQDRILDLAEDARQLIITIGPPKPQPSEASLAGGAGGATWDTFYVRTDGHDTNCDGTANASDASTETTACAWLTVDKAANTATTPGDWIRVQAGTYAELVSPEGTAGTLAAPITFVADGAVTICRVTLGDGENYHRFIGFTIDGDTVGCVQANEAVLTAGTTVGNEFWHNTMRDSKLEGITANARSDRQNNWIVIGNTFTAIPAVGSNGIAVGFYGNDDIVAYNTVTEVDPDTFQNFVNDSYYLNNYAETFISGTKHGDVFQQNSSAVGTARNLYEANWFLGMGSTTGDEHGTLFQDQDADGSAECSSTTCGEQTENMFRRNVWHNFEGNVHSVAEQSVSTGTQNARLVHESFIDNVKDPSSPTDYVALLRNNTGTPQGVNNGFFFNNLVYGGYDGDTTGISVFFVQNGPTNALWTAADYNLAYDPGATLSFAANWTNQANEQSNVDPDLTDFANDDFTLGASSGATGAAGPLTTASGSGTGTTFNVQAGFGGFFKGPNGDIDQYGGNLTEGDKITVGTDQLTVVSVSTDAVTVDASFTWADTDAVYYGWDTTPDIGAFPRKAGGYTLTATYAASGGTVTITPNDADLVRWVVCYTDGVPYAVDNASPFTCARAVGTFSAKAFKRYASNGDLWVEATP